jgi:hypothetical protein
MLERLRAALCCALLAAATGVAVQAILLLHAATGRPVAYLWPFLPSFRPRARHS